MKDMFGNEITEAQARKILGAGLVGQPRKRKDPTPAGYAWRPGTGPEGETLIWDRPVGPCQVGFQDRRGKDRNKPTLSGKEAAATPLAFRDILIDMARSAGSVNRTTETEKENTNE